jgi:hypothetical protein
MTLSGVPPPPLRYSLIEMVPYFLYSIVEKFPVQVLPKYHNAPPPPNEGRAGARGVTIIMKRGFLQSKNILKKISWYSVDEVFPSAFSGSLHPGRKKPEKNHQVLRT